MGRHHDHLLHTLIPEDSSPESGTLPALRLNSECAETKEGEGGFVSNVDDAEGSAADLDAAPVPSIVVPCIGGSERGCCGSADAVGNCSAITVCNALPNFLLVSL